MSAPAYWKERAAAHAAAKAAEPARRAAAAERNRAAMPTIAAVLDDFRKHFGPGVRVLYASENGHELGDRRTFDEIEREFGRNK